MSRILSSVNWTISSSIINALIAITAGAILARILGPSAYGIIAIANLVVSFASYFVRMGVGPALIHHENLTQDDIDFSTTFSMGVGLLATIVIALIAPLIAIFFDKPESAAVVAVMGFSLWFSASSNNIASLLQRSMQFKQTALVNLGQSLTAAIFSISLAYLGLGVWSLVWSQIASRLISMIILFSLVYRIYPIRPRFSFIGHEHLLKFGAKYSINSFLEYIGSNLDTIFVGKLFPAAQLGFYNRSYLLAYLPTENIMASINSVMFPVFSRLQTDQEKFKKAQLRLLLLTGLISSTIAMGMIPVTENLVLLLLGEKWLTAAPIMTVILLAVPFDFMAVSMAITFDASGNLKQKTGIQTVTIFALAVGIFAFSSFGLIGIAYALAISHAFRFLLYLFKSKTLFSIPVSSILKTIGIIGIAGALTFLGSAVSLEVASRMKLNNIFSLILSIFSCAIITSFMFFANSPSLLNEKTYKQSFIKIKKIIIKN